LFHRQDGGPRRDFTNIAELVKTEMLFHGRPWFWWLPAAAEAEALVDLIHTDAKMF